MHCRRRFRYPDLTVANIARPGGFRRQHLEASGRQPQRSSLVVEFWNRQDIRLLFDDENEAACSAQGHTEHLAGTEKTVMTIIKSFVGTSLLFVSAATTTHIHIDAL